MCDGHVAVIVGISLRPYRMVFSFAVANADYVAAELWVSLMRCEQRRKTNEILSRQIKSPSRSMLSTIHREGSSIIKKRMRGRVRSRRTLG
jgi:hypothetical protein